jgi:hypothetical protein
VSSTRPQAGSGADPEAAYYQAVEEFFVSRRGDPLFLSNADWLLVRKWRLAGLPLRIVLRGIADALEDHAHSWSRKRKVGSLAYCAAEVDAAAERWRRALALGEEEGVDAAGFLRSIGEAARAARGLGPRAAPLVQELLRELPERSAEPARVREVEAWLAARETALLAALREDAGQAVAAIEASVDADIGRYRERMPARVFDQLRRDSVSRRLLAAHGLPRLSLFGL